MSTFFSFVIPCCNVEPYIRECLASVKNQSFQDWECLIGIETSTDRTDEVIREFTAGDERFHIFHGPRSGSCSASRNTGIDMAQGEYVIFLDGDDSIAEESLDRLAAQINANPGADLYLCDMVAYNDKTGAREHRNNYTAASPSEMTGPEAILELDRLWHGRFCPQLQLLVCRREFLLENKLKCVYGLRAEDLEMSPRALYRANRVVPLQEFFYLYRIHDNSVTAAKKPGHLYKDLATALKSLLAFYTTASQEPNFDPRVLPCWARQLLGRLYFMWFSPYMVKKIPRAWRLETLQLMFSGSFEDFNFLLRHTNLSKRVAGWWVRAFVKYSALRGTAELFSDAIIH